MAPQVPRKILVFGATGVIGKYIIEEIVNASSSFDKIGLFTSPFTAQNKADEINSWKEKGVDINIGDVNSEDDIKKAYEGYDTVVSALGRNAILAQVPLLKLANASTTIKFFYPSEYGTDIEYSPASATEKPHQLKLQVRRYIRENVTDLSVTYLVTGPYSDLFLGPSSDPRIGSFDPKTARATLLGTGEERVSFTTMRDVGRLLVAALRTPSPFSERVLKVNSFTTTGKQALGEFENQTGRKWEVQFTSLEDLKALEEKAWEEDWPTKTPLTLKRIWTEGGTLYERRDNGSIGFEGEDTLGDQVRNTIAKHG